MINPHLCHLLHCGSFSSGSCSDKPSGSRWEVESGSERSLLTRSPVEAWNPLKIRAFHPLPVMGLILMDAGVPSPQLCLCFLLTGLHRLSYLLCPYVPVCQVGTYVHVTARKVHEASKACPSPQDFVQQFHVWAEKLLNGQSLLHYWLLASCCFSSPGIFLTPFRQKSKLGAEKRRPTQVTEALGELLELAGSLSMFSVVRWVLKCYPRSRVSST